MKARTIVGVTSLLLSALGLALLAAIPAGAQASRANTALERRIDTMNRQARDYDRDSLIRETKGKNSAETAKQRREIKLQIEEDLKALQDAYNRSVKLMQNSGEVTPEFVAEISKSVERSARRLKANLVLPKPKGPEKEVNTARPNSRAELLTELCRTIYSLITSPLFEDSTGLDIELAARADQDLEAMIELSTRLTGELSGRNN